jgi:uncharacterized membrane protein
MKFLPLFFMWSLIFAAIAILLVILASFTGTGLLQAIVFALLSITMALLSKTQ